MRVLKNLMTKKGNEKVATIMAPVTERVKNRYGTFGFAD